MCPGITPRWADPARPGPRALRRAQPGPPPVASPHPPDEVGRRKPGTAPRPHRTPSPTRGLHNACRSTPIEVRYRWHPLFGQSVTVQGGVAYDERPHWVCVVPGREDRSGLAIPAWMFSEARCAPMRLEARPQVEWSALVALTELLDAAPREDVSTVASEPGLGMTIGHGDGQSTHSSPATATAAQTPTAEPRMGADPRPQQGERSPSSSQAHSRGRKGSSSTRRRRGGGR